jgi:hypothetical protein
MLENESMLSRAVSRGQEIGIHITRHRFRDGGFRDSKTKEGPNFCSRRRTSYQDVARTRVIAEDVP